MIIDGSRAADRTAALILRYFAALNRGDVDGVLDCLDDDVVHERDTGAREAGKAAFREFVRRAQAAGREEVRDVVVMSVDDGTRAAAEFRVHGVDGSTERYVLGGGAFFTIHQGKIARIAPYRQPRPPAG